MNEMNRRQEIRRAILFLSFIMFPITYYYFSPYLIIDGASQGIITGSFLTFTVFFVVSLVFGRVFCGWLCPAGGLQRLCLKVNNKNFKGGKRDLVKYAMWIPWITIIVLMFMRARGVKSIYPLYQT